MYWVENQSNEIERKGFPVIPNRDVSNTILVLSSSLRAWNAYVAQLEKTLKPKTNAHINI